MTTTTHLSLFNLNGERVLLKTPSPAMIADGDHLRVAGLRGQGQFTGTACKNLTTGWMTPYKEQGCAKSVVIGFGLVGIVFTLIFPLFIFLPVFSAVVFVLITRADTRLKNAHRMLEQ
ncbi:MAG: hypothetical protein JJU05_09260 [Verrucomicrobia bacterium]|nr:hypothetical protein [Verrucomicrobiota bacterium]MCH8527602.1 hypothetical protein [Kiritimatiellia bacterium]